MEQEDDFELDTVRLLIEQARDGDAQAKSELASQVQGYLTMMADRKLNASIRSNVNPSDIVQHTLIRMVDGIDNFRGQTRAEFFGWLNTIVQNESSRANRHFRSQKRDVARQRSMTQESSGSFIFVEPSDSQPTPQTNALSAERVQLLHKLLKKLPEEHGEVIRLPIQARLTCEQRSPGWIPQNVLNDSLTQRADRHEWIDSQSR